MAPAVHDVSGVDHHHGHVRDARRHQIRHPFWRVLTWAPAPARVATLVLVVDFAGNMLYVLPRRHGHVPHRDRRDWQRADLVRRRGARAAPRRDVPGGRVPARRRRCRRTLHRVPRARGERRRAGDTAGVHVAAQAVAPRGVLLGAALAGGGDDAQCGVYVVVGLR